MRDNHLRPLRGGSMPAIDHMLGAGTARGSQGRS